MVPQDNAGKATEAKPVPRSRPASTTWSPDRTIGVTRWASIPNILTVVSDEFTDVAVNLSRHGITVVKDGRKLGFAEWWRIIQDIQESQIT